MNDLVTIATFYKATEAEAVCALLNEAGIPAFVADAELANTNFLLTTAVGGVKVQTAAVDAERARALVDAQGGFRRGEPDEEEEEDGSTKCLACGTTIAEDDDTCPKCGWSYDREED
jgi:rubrerythrin